MNYKPFILIIILIMSTTSVMAGALRGIDRECIANGFSEGVVKWEYDNGWHVENDGDNLTTSVTGTDTSADWNVGQSGATGIVVKAGSTVEYAIIGTSGTVNEIRPSTSHITFCKDREQDVPEFGTLAALGLLVAAGLFIYKKRK